MASRNWERVWLGFLFQLAAVAGGMADERTAVVALGAVEVTRVLDVGRRRVDEPVKGGGGPMVVGGADLAEQVVGGQGVGGVSLPELGSARLWNPTGL